MSAINHMKTTCRSAIIAGLLTALALAGGSVRGQSAFKALINFDGMHRLDATNIAAQMGVSTGQVESWLAAKQLAVENLGRVQPSIYESNAISFFAARFESRYTALNTYWIRNAPGLPMGSISSAAASVTSGKTFSEMRIMEQHGAGAFNADIFFDQNDDPFMWTELKPSSTFSKTLTSVVALPGVSAGETMTVRVMPVAASRSNIVSVSISNVFGNVVVGSFLAQGNQAVTWTGSISAVSLSPSNNTVRITATITNGQAIYVDKYEIRYRRLYLAITNELLFTASSNDPITVYGFTSNNIEIVDVTDPGNMKLVVGLTMGGGPGNYSASFRPAGNNNKYFAVAGGLRRNPAQLVKDIPSDLRNPLNGKDYIAICTPAFSNSAQTMVNYRSSHNLSAGLVDLQDIYDEFNYGIPDARAIRAFLGYAYYSWAISPRYVVLLGEGSLDYRNYLGNGDCIIPPLRAGDFFGLQASDQPHGDFDANGSTEVAIGRLPISTTAEFDTIYSKLQIYETGGSWKTSMVCLADVPDPAGNFELDNDYISGLSPVHSVEKNYIAQQPSLNAAHTNLINSLNRGRGLMTYFGHGNELKLTINTNILEKVHVLALTNVARPSVVMAMTCLTGDYGTPGTDSLGETFLIATNGGIAVWAAGKQQFDADGRSLAAAFVSNIFVAGNSRLGDGMIAATAANIDRAYACQAYNLLGDPALAAGNINAARPGPFYPSGGPTNYANWREIAMAPTVLDLGVGMAENDDADGDGIKNKDEYTAGTDPLDQSSKLVITYVSKPSSSQNMVKWNSSTRKKYDLERTTNIVNGAYVPVAYDINATPSINVFTDSTVTVTGPVFYRVRAK